MSLLLAIALNDSIIMASDSRTTYIYKDRVEYKDVSNKMSLKVVYNIQKKKADKER